VHTKQQKQCILKDKTTGDFYHCRIIAIFKKTIAVFSMSALSYVIYIIDSYGTNALMKWTLDSFNPCLSHYTVS